MPVKKSAENENIQIPNNSNNLNDQDEENDELILKPKQKKNKKSEEPINQVEEIVDLTDIEDVSLPNTNAPNYQPIKKHRVRSEKQKEATEKMIAKLKENNELKKQKKQEEELRIKKELEDKIVKKAISIKKKQIKQQQILDAISDDETSIESIKKIIKKPIVKNHPPKEEIEKPKFIFI
jgi:hypothetical protein